MASNGVEDVTLESDGTVRVDSFKPPRCFSPSTLQRRFKYLAPPRGPIQCGPGTRTNVRDFQDRIRFFSGIPPQRAYLSVSTTANGASTSEAATRIALHSSVSLPFDSPCVLEQTIHSYRPNWRLESFKFKSGILGKRAFSSPQPAVSPANPVSPHCPIPPKANSLEPLNKTETDMPFTQRPTRTNKPAINTNTFMRPTSAKVPSYHKLDSNTVQTYLTASHCNGDKGDSKIENRATKLNGPMLFLKTSPSTLSREKRKDMILEEISWQAHTSEGCATPLRAERMTCKSEGNISHRLEKAGNVNSEIMLTKAVRRMSGNSSAKNRMWNGFCRQPQGHEGHSEDSQLSHSNERKATESPQGECISQSSVKTSNSRHINGDSDGSHMQMQAVESSNIIKAHIFSNLSDAVVTKGNVDAMQQKRAPQKTDSSQMASVSLVTTQISAIQLNKETKSHKSGDERVDMEMKELGADYDEMQQDLDEDGDEEELPDALEEDDNSQDDDESDCSSVTEESSASSVVVYRSFMEDSSQVCSNDSRVLKPALVPSLFSTKPPTIYFSTPDEKVELLPLKQRKLLRWKMSSVTPNVVRHTIARSHFKVTKRNHDWLGCWGHHMKSPGFKAIQEHQKLNHFPGSFQIGRKDRLWRNLSKMQARFGKKEFNFFPQSYVLPQDIKLLKKSWEEAGSKQKWIVKPPASARGIGIQVIHKWNQLPRRRPLLVQKYLNKPYLINGCKFDLRIYVYVTSYDPLRIYMFTDGLVRFASCKYSTSMKSLSNKFMHLTNYSVNKKNSEYKPNSDEKACQGHKWSDPYVNSLLKMHVRRPYCCHELFGFDIMLDESLKPWILEVNISPSLHSNSALDVAIKGQMISDLLNLAGFVLPLKGDVTGSRVNSSTSSMSGQMKERTRYTAELSSDEKVKRAYFLSQRFADQEFYSSILEVLTVEDVRVLSDTEDEFCRRGEFERVYPSFSSSRYLRFFEQPRYLNILLNQWEQKYYLNKVRGIELLRNLCQKGVQLGTTCDPAHVWSKSHSIQKPEAPVNGSIKQETVTVSTSVKRKKCDELTGDFEQISSNRSLPTIGELGTNDYLLLPPTPNSLHDITQAL
ncbi:tubulin polyglutamylase TTLL4 isoform X2 [Polyodon spathula]|uniref:tubulin polyglutamylase TTLL4 isoform X2 n=1 Tax=Polyodon spathula TaxID=7913 RepID=UPI001B7EFC27|nr:tubulin polyglutamylase TTLL4 isoform X2 [Polyodon spathula]